MCGISVVSVGTVYMAKQPDINRNLALPSSKCTSCVLDLTFSNDDIVALWLRDSRDQASQ